jgi:hypothetical protein
MIGQLCKQWSNIMETYETQTNNDIKLGRIDVQGWVLQ